MPKIKIEGNHELSGTITVGGAKNSVVALIPAAILCDETVTISNVPDITDVDDLEKILVHLNAKIERSPGTVVINSSDIINKEITQELSKKLRASYYFMGALLGKFNRVDMYFPGGCAIGARPINLHLKGFESLGATITEEDNHFIIEAKALKDCPNLIGTASCNCVRPIFITSLNSKALAINSLYNFCNSLTASGNIFNIVSFPAVGNTSFVDCAILTSSFG